MKSLLKGGWWKKEVETNKKFGTGKRKNREREKNRKNIFGKKKFDDQSNEVVQRNSIVVFLGFWGLAFQNFGANA